MDDLVERLREISQEKQQEAWGRADGGQDLSIGAMLADEAADEITTLRARLEAVDAQLQEQHRVRKAWAERAERAEAELRMIVSHATGGETTGEGMSVNDISVRITAFRNVVYEGGKDVGAKKAEAALAAARRDAYERAAQVAETAKAVCARCNSPEDNHPYRHPFVPVVMINIPAAIRALANEAPE